MDGIQSDSIFARYSDADVLAAVREHHIADVVVAGTVEDAPHYFRGRRTHAVHEQFAIVTEHGVHLQIVDNVDLAPAIPVRVGDVVVVAGQFIPQASGGLIHDTHHCPGPGWHRGGWIEWRGSKYELPT